MHNQPAQLLDELETLRKENERLRSLMSYIATCLSKTQWGNEGDQQYAEGLAIYTLKQIGNTAEDEDQEFHRLKELGEQAAMRGEDEAREQWLTYGEPISSFTPVNYDE